MSRTRNQPRMTPDGFEPGAVLNRFQAPEVSARVAPASYDSDARTVEAVLTTGARVRRFGMFEELAVTPDAIDLGRVGQGQVRLLDTHNSGSIDAVLGVVTSVRFEGERLIGTIRFAETEAGRRAERMVQSGDATGISVGYRVTNWTLRSVENDVEIWRAERWELLEASLVAVPADPAAMVRSEPAIPAAPVTPRAPAQNEENDDMRRNLTPAAEPAANPADQTRVAPAAGNPPAADAAASVAAERTRAAQITELATRHGMPAEFAPQHILNNASVDQVRAAILDHVAATARATDTPNVRVIADETETRRVAMEEAVTRGIGGSAVQGDWSAPALAYRGWSLVDLAAERLGIRRVPSDFAGREQILQRAMHATTDFPIILENALNRNLARRYELEQPTYRQIAMREDFNDFRPHDTVTPGDFPTLQPVGEGGKFKFGTFGEKKETVAVGSYAVQFGITRQMLVNDRLGALQNVLNAWGTMVNLFEERTFYAVFLANNGAGPTLLEGAAAMFTTNRTNLASTPAAISETSVSLGRAAMRKFKSIDKNELLYNAPSILLVGPDKETEAQKFVAQIIPDQTSNVNVFAGKLNVLVSQMIPGNAWYLAVDPSIRPNFRYGLLSGYEAPRIRVDEPFGQSGMGVSVEHDFGAGGIDWRGMYRNAGA